MKGIIRIGTRKSKLAITQGNIIARIIKDNYPELKVQIITYKTEGDLLTNESLYNMQGKGVFVKEIEKALI